MNIETRPLLDNIAGKHELLRGWDVFDLFDLPVAVALVVEAVVEEDGARGFSEAVSLLFGELFKLFENVVRLSVSLLRT